MPVRGDITILLTPISGLPTTLIPIGVHITTADGSSIHIMATCGTLMTPGAISRITTAAGTGIWPMAGTGYQDTTGRLPGCIGGAVIIIMDGAH